MSEKHFMVSAHIFFLFLLQIPFFVTSYTNNSVSVKSFLFLVNPPAAAHSSFTLIILCLTILTTEIQDCGFRGRSSSNGIWVCKSPGAYFFFLSAYSESWVREAHFQTGLAFLFLCLEEKKESKTIWLDGWIILNIWSLSQFEVFIFSCKRGLEVGDKSKAHMVTP